MNKRIFTSSYDKCGNIGNLISISGDRGKMIGFTGKALPQLAPKLEFWNIWHSNIGKISQEENTEYYIKEYYKQVLLKVNIEELLKNEKNPILLCYEKSEEFCHRHIVAEYIQMKYGIVVPEIEITSELEIKQNERPKNVRKVLENIMKREQLKGTNR